VSGGPACLQLEPRNSARSSVSVGAAAGAGAGLLVGRHPKVPAGPFFWAWAGGVGGALGAALGPWFGDTEADEYSAVGGVFVVALLGSVLGGIVGGALDGGLADLPPGALRGVLLGLCLALLMVLLAGMARKVLFRLGTLPVLGLAGRAAAACAAGLPYPDGHQEILTGALRCAAGGIGGLLGGVAVRLLRPRPGGVAPFAVRIVPFAAAILASVGATAFLLGQSSLVARVGQSGRARALALSPEGDRALFSRDEAGTAPAPDLKFGRLVDLKTGAGPRLEGDYTALHAHKDEVRALSLTPDGRRALTASAEAVSRPRAGRPPVRRPRRPPPAGRPRDRGAAAVRAALMASCWPAPATTTASTCGRLPRARRRRACAGTGARCAGWPSARTARPWPAPPITRSNSGT
jgi:hypothetical protein